MCFFYQFYPNFEIKEKKHKFIICWKNKTTYLKSYPLSSCRTSVNKFNNIKVMVASLLDSIVMRKPTNTQKSCYKPRC